MHINIVKCDILIEKIRSIIKNTITSFIRLINCITCLNHCLRNRKSCIWWRFINPRRKEFKCLDVLSIKVGILSKKIIKIKWNVWKSPGSTKAKCFQIWESNNLFGFWGIGCFYNNFRLGYFSIQIWEIRELITKIITRT